MQAPTADVQGIGLYTEFWKGDVVLVLLVVPDGHNEKGELIGATTIRRANTPKVPDGKWSIVSTIPITQEVNIGPPGTPEHLEARFQTIGQPLLDQIIQGEWKVIDEPFYVEVSRKDYQLISEGKVPGKLMYRCKQTATAQGYRELKVDV